MSDPFDYTGKAVFVVGGTSGINLGIAHAFAQRGAKMALMGRKQEKLDAAVAEVQAHGGAVIGFSADVRDHAAVEAAFKQAADELGTFDVVVSGAAGNFPAPALGLSPNGFKSVVDIDLLGTFHVMKAAFPVIKQPGGSIINISAPQAFLAMQMQSHVCAAKAGVDMVTRTLAMEWGPMGIRVNSIVPGPIDGTEGMKRLAPTPEAHEVCVQSVPLKRMGTPEDIGNMAVFLGSDMASYVSGTVIPVDGGWANGGAAEAMGRILHQLTGGKS